MTKKLLGVLALSLVLIGSGCDPLTPDTPDIPQVVPFSGSWDYAMSTAGNSCLTRGLTASGIGEVVVSDDASAILLSLDGRQLAFTAQGGGAYATGQRFFPSQTPTGGVTSGNVTFRLNVLTTDYMTGVIDWHANGCSGDYHFTLSLNTPELPDSDAWDSYDVQEGSWEMELEDELGDCEPPIAGFTDFEGPLEFEHPMDADTGEIVETEIEIAGTDVVLELVPGTDTWVQIGTADPGLPVDASGDLLLDYDGVPFELQLDLEATGPDSMEGELYAGSDACNMSASVTLTH